MDSLELVVAEEELGVGRGQCEDAVINGERLRDLVLRAEGEDVGYAGMHPPGLSDALRRLEPASDVQVLRCICGDDMCSWAAVHVVVGEDVVVWSDLRASRRPAPVYAGIGPFSFDRAAYDRAIRQAPQGQP